ncbi:hypothetical protein EV177_008968, partial [Coemansia sp. RSA 1804]
TQYYIRMAEIDNKFQAESVAINVKLSDPEGDATFMLEVVLHEGVVVEVKEIFKGFVKTLDSESSIAKSAQTPGFQHCISTV